jgi:hypothetical protein
MAEYIDREALLEEMRKSYCGTCNNYNEVLCRACMMDDALRDIEDAPAADVVEVVRCKDCAHCEHFYPEKQIGEEAREAYYCGIRKTTVRATDFCSFGERKEGK